MDKITLLATDALIIVDMQNDFCLPTGALYVAGVQGESTMDKISDRIDHFLLKPFGFLGVTFDRHPTSGHVEFDLYGRHAVEGTPGAEYVSELEPVVRLADFVLVKGGDPTLISYSGSVSREWGELIACLRRKEIRRIFVCGVAYTHCAGETAISFAVQNVPVADKSWEVYIIRDATRSVPPPYGDPELMTKKLALYGVKEILAADLGIA